MTANRPTQWAETGPATWLAGTSPYPDRPLLGLLGRESARWNRALAASSLVTGVAPDAQRIEWAASCARIGTPRERMGMVGRRIGRVESAVSGNVPRPCARTETGVGRAP